MCVRGSWPELGVIGFTFSSVRHGCFAGFLFQPVQLTHAVVRAAVCLPDEQGSSSPSPSLPGPSFQLMQIFMALRKLNLGKVVVFRFKQYIFAVFTEPTHEHLSVPARERP